MRHPGRAAALAVMLALAGCSGGEGQQMAGPEQMHYDDAATAVKQRADAVAEVLAVPLAEPYFSAPPCEDPAGNPSRTGVYHIHASFTLPVGDRVGDVLRTAHSHFTGRGFEVRDITWFDDGSGDLRATSPDGFEYALLATSSPDVLAFWVDSPCYQAPADAGDPSRWVPRFSSPGPTPER